MEQQKKSIIFYEICRLCLDEHGHCDIFDKNDLQENIFKCIGVKVSLVDSLPQKICAKCLEIVNKAAELRIIAKKNDVHLKSLFCCVESETSEVCAKDSVETVESSHYERDKNVSQEKNTAIEKFLSVRKDLFDSSVSEDSVVLKNESPQANSSQNQDTVKKKCKNVNTEYKCNNRMDQRKRLNYSKEALNEAIKIIHSKLMSVRKASKTFNIPKTTLIDKLKNKYTKNGKIGAPTILTTEEEDILEKWIIEMVDKGFPVTKIQLLESVTKLVENSKREKAFKNGTPGNKWYKGFLKRHPQCSTRVPQLLTSFKAAVTEIDICDWLGCVRSSLMENNQLHIMSDPRRIFNSDENGFYLSPKEHFVLVKKDLNKVNLRTDNDKKEYLTVLITVSADGNMPPPMTLFPYKRIPSYINSNYPKSWAIGKTDTGWMTSAAFFEYLVKVFYPWIIKNKIPLPVIFFIDRHTSHINLHITEFCNQNGILLTAFNPDAKRMLQPLDVAVFHPLKNVWCKSVSNWRINNSGQNLRHEDFAKVLELSIDAVVTPEIVRNSFRACGLSPFDENNINYSKLINEIKTNIQESEEINKEQDKIDEIIQNGNDNLTENDLNQSDLNITLQNSDTSDFHNIFEKVSIDINFWTQNDLFEDDVGSDSIVKLLSTSPSEKQDEETLAKDRGDNEKSNYLTAFKKALFLPEENIQKRKATNTIHSGPKKKEKFR